MTICSSVCCQNAKMRFSQKLSNLEPWSLLTTYRKSYMGFSGSLKSKMAEIRHLKNRHDVIFSAEGGQIWIKISETGAEWHVDCGDVVEIEIRCRIPIWRTFGLIQWHAIPQPRITLQGAATCWSYCHDFRATCHIAGCKNSIRHIENSFSPYFIIFFVFNAV